MMARHQDGDVPALPPIGEEILLGLRTLFTTAKQRDWVCRIGWDASTGTYYASRKPGGPVCIIKDTSEMPVPPESRLVRVVDHFRNGRGVFAQLIPEEESRESVHTPE